MKTPGPDEAPASLARRTTRASAGATRSAAVSSTLPTLSGGTLRIVDGPDAGRSVAITKEGVRVGSGEGVDLRVNDAAVSREHLLVRLSLRGFFVKDLGSRNGVFFEGSAVSEAAVPPGALLRIGQTTLVLSTADRWGPADEALDASEWQGLVGRSLVMRRVFKKLERAAESALPVLLMGESGTGKELAAEGLHKRSGRPGAFVVVDCGAIQPELLPATLLGHERGAFTGAVDSKAGVFERASNGTLFLDNVAELPLELQPHLLRLCEDATVTRVGGQTPRACDVRLVVASRADLPEEVARRRFRADLYYRLAVLPVVLPPLRERPDDLELLCAHFLARLERAPGPIRGPNLARLRQHAWPGNLRELRNVLERAVAYAEPTATFETLPLDVSVVPTMDPEAPFQEQKAHAIEQFERRYFQSLMQQCNFQIKTAARISGIDRTHLKRTLRKYGMI